MPQYHVEYSYDVTEYELIDVEAKNLEDVSNVVADLLQESRRGLFIESIEEIKNVA